MKKLGYFKKSLLMSAVALSVLSSPANAVSEEEVHAYWAQLHGITDCKENCIDSGNLEKLVRFNDAQWNAYKATVQSFIKPGMYITTRIVLGSIFASVSPDAWLHKDFISTASSFVTGDLDGIKFVIPALGCVLVDEMDRVYGQIQRLQSELDPKIKFKRAAPFVTLLSYLELFKSDIQSQKFMTCLIRLIKTPGVKDIIESEEDTDDVFLSFIEFARSQALREASDETQMLHRRGLAPQVRSEEQGS